MFGLPSNHVGVFQVLIMRTGFEQKNTRILILSKPASNNAARSATANMTLDLWRGSGSGFKYSHSPAYDEIVG